MINSENRPIRAIKEGAHECSCYVDELTRNTNILEIADGFGLQVNQQGYAECPQHHDSTLTIDGEKQTFRCIDPTCNDHGDVITLVQRLFSVPFEHAAKVLANDTEFSRWIDPHPDQARVYGLVRDCMGDAARTYAARLNAAMDYLASRGIGEETARRFMLGICSGGGSKEY